MITKTDLDATPQCGACSASSSSSAPRSYFSRSGSGGTLRPFLAHFLPPDRLSSVEGFSTLPRNDQFHRKQPRREPEIANICPGPEIVNTGPQTEGTTFDHLRSNGTHFWQRRKSWYGPIHFCRQNGPKTSHVPQNFWLAGPGSPIISTPAAVSWYGSSGRSRLFGGTL